MNNRIRLRTIYDRFMNLMHRPLVKNGADDPYHAVFAEFISMTRQVPSAVILEIGSRNVSGITRRELFPHVNKYMGFDVLPGEGVDIVGDAHKLSAFFTPNQFDFVYSISVFEHLLFPWKAVLEINSVLKTGGHVFLSTHPVWPPHELPWDFWRFPSGSFSALFNAYTGFEIVSLTEGLPSKMYSLVNDPPTQTNCFHTVNQGVALIAKKTDGYRRDLLKWDVEVSEVIDTMYPDDK